MALQVKKFRAPTLQQAIEMVRLEMGDDAIILQTDPIKTTGGKFMTADRMEVTAAIDREDEPQKFHATVSEAPEERAEKAGSATNGLSALLSKANFGFKPKKPAAPQAPQRTTSKPTPSPAVPMTTASPASGADSQAPTMGQIYAVKTFIEPIKEEVDALKRELQKKDPSLGKKKFKDPLEEEVQKLRSELHDFIIEKKFDGSNLPKYFRKLLTYWKDMGMTEKQIHGLFQQIQNWGHSFDAETSETLAAEHMNHLLEGAIQEANVLSKTDRRIVILVGPTGVGKTTTIAKMAAHEKLKLKRSVAFVTVDDFKIGGTDQLAHYARILEVPFAKSRADMSLEEQCKLSNAQTIFVDTFGLSIRDAERMKTLKKMIEFQDPELAKRIEIHLVLPVGIASQDVHDFLEAYGALKPKYLAFTKWDETSHWGGMLGAILESRKPVSFISYGQNVPDDFALFSKTSFIETVTAGAGE